LQSGRTRRSRRGWVCPAWALAFHLPAGWYSHGTWSASGVGPSSRCPMRSCRAVTHPLRAVRI
jgi:hypothetical protein